MLFWRETIIVANLRILWHTILISGNCAGVQKMTNYRYDVLVMEHMLSQCLAKRDEEKDSPQIIIVRCQLLLITI